MPRQPGGLNGLPIHRRGGYWICYVRDAAGKRYQRALHLRDDGTEASRRAAIAAYWQEQARATSGAYAERRAPKPLGKALQALTERQETEGLSQASLDKTFYMGRNLVGFFGRDFDLNTLTESQQLVEYAADARQHRSALTVNTELWVLRQAMEAVGLQRPRAPKLKGRPKPQDPFTREEQLRLLAAATPKHRLTLLLLLTLGPRRTEAARHCGDVDWDKQTMWIHGTKTERSNREVPIPDELFEHMKWLRAIGEWHGFPRVSGQRIGAIVRQACKRAGIRPRSINSTRGTASRNMREAGIDPELRAAVQGNSAREQERTYTQTHTLLEAMRGAVNAPKRLTRKRKQEDTGS